ncbi:ribonuclease G [Paraferrimonas sedimenticola]|uniref:Ribonuclease G n=1 Tax=Paraferrimonas sedimenticola TaxID=375674 RepID=A0AA37RY30_9GAMM|nr:ribonuclease G [Paraferrimonas sedimenticola]GLP97368.1 ribonuclease G Rng [Paraferrimonas sedimenticola]
MNEYADGRLGAELLINVTPTESRVALVENGILQEIHIERRMKRGLVGNIYKGKVTRVLPGMQAAFVDIGLEKAAFLHASDIVNHNECVADDDKQKLQANNIGRLVHQGQELVVQVVKDPLGTKGARLTTDITLPSRYLVFMPGASHVGVSQRIESEAERERLRKLTEPFVDENGGFIIRTAAEGVGEDELVQDAVYLRQVWQKVLERKRRKGVKDLYRDMILPVRIVRDFVGTKLDRVMVDSRETIEELALFCREFMPELNDKLQLYRGPNPLFDQYDVENEIQRALEKRVDLKSGGYMIVDQTEAMTTIDLNTGAFVGSRNLEETIFNLNLEATQAIARQLRLRNLGGIIIIDFIDMVNENHKNRVLTALEQALSRDRVKTNISGFSSLGLVEMTRKRTRESLEHILCSDCPCCQGRGTLKTVETVSFEILREIIRVDRTYDADEFVVYCAPAVHESLSTQDNELLAELEVYLGKKIHLRNEQQYNQEKFDVVMM